ncbi:hypothetical protein [Hymenobacter cellulosilyticus]|uniref:Uncharacterized protein n=1 Tax=Hymenobacter cellulosilyticus TaxID=2932248 RepID=A0A8T9Q550_9BACT|nr:hypothetical protein [Hymenobacter cellulosilyticus]UOQ72102.1 hypothetical protein MUN79_26635 [Hymenobacter cellulosilyticus]
MSATLGLTVAACSGPAAEKTGAVKEAAQVPIAAIPPSEQPPCLLPEYDLKMVEASPKTAEQAKLSTTLVAEMVRQNPQLPRLFKDYNKYWELYALDTVRCKEFMIVSYLYRHEDCCSDVYYVTFSPDGKKVIDWATIANTGMDGMWSATATMNTQQIRLRVTELEQDSEDDGQPGFWDSVVTDYSVTPQGKFVRARVDSVRMRQAAR